MSIKEEDISPSMARELLETSYGNRPINQPTVLEYAVAMDGDRWSPTACMITLDERGKLIDGHHRLNAVILCGKTVRMLVQRDVPTSDRDVKDTGRQRTLNDMTAMYTRRSNVSNYNAALNVCVNLVSRGIRRPKIRSLETAARWGKLFEEGLEYAVPMIVAQRKGPKIFRHGYVAGAFAFAFKRNPQAVKSFMKAVMHGESIDRSMPAYTVRAALLDGSKHRVVSGTSDTTFKILSGLYATIKGQSYKTAQAGREGYIYFLEAYDNAQVKNLMEPFIRFTSARQEAIDALSKEVRERGQALGRKS